MEPALLIRIHPRVSCWRVRKQKSNLVLKILTRDPVVSEPLVLNLGFFIEPFLSLDISKTVSPSACWKTYRRLVGSKGKQPSGADLAAQLVGDVICFDIPSFEAGKTPENLWLKLNWSDLLVFSAPDRKVQTHEHLDQLTRFPKNLTRDLNTIVQNGYQAVSEGDSFGLGQAMFEYGARLNGAGFEDSNTESDRKAFKELLGVAGVKGSGAMQSDIVLVYT